jgi:putative membrane protein
MLNFLKGIIVGIGGVAPGLSGSVLLIIFGLYQQTLDALGTILTNFKKNIKFLLPIITGMFCGVLLFSKVVDFFLYTYEMPTRFCFLGLILGTIPLFYKELKKEGFSNKYYVVVLASIVLGTLMFTLNPNLFPQIAYPNFIQSIILGIAVVATAIIPGLDPAVVLSTLGYYEAYVKALANVDLMILGPMLIGLVIGGIGISSIMSTLFKKHYTFTFSIVFGLFLSMIPNMLNESCVLGFNLTTFISMIVMILGFVVSYYLGDIENNNRKLKSLYKKGGRE